ncbi:UNVERIFIED_CONTAM: hypothetical protein Sradi_7121900 [Sesamum radiatum]|uniref:Uncharacterized protein n=1 Tax=Sesamum radiatum TaxID=300843 RepID=A0AAW2J1Z0_SESRA
MIFQFPSGPRHTALPPTAPLSTVIWQDTWAWPHITDMESIDITHDLPTIHGGRDRILWTGPRGSFSSAAAYDLFRPPGPTVGWSSLLGVPSTFHGIDLSYGLLFRVAYLPQISLGYNIWALCVSYARMDFRNHMSIYSLCAPLPVSAYVRYGGRFSFIGHIITGQQLFAGCRYGGAGNMWLMLRTGHFLLHLSIIYGASAISGYFSILHALLRR